MLIFAVLALAIGRVTRLDFSVIASLAVVFGLLGLVLIVPTARLAESRTRKTLFVLTGVSAAGIPISVILHNLFYGPFIAWFGEGFRGPGGDEPVFFVLAIFVCPALFLVSAVASGILLLKVRFAKNKNEPQQGVSGLRFSLSAKNIASTLASVVYKGV
ncbi:MAG: hypothetical protein KKC51_02880 [Verrucomicrobia bacterium]|nr:hypothetical protein [Verrucomicrobiota bacterium]